MTAAFKQKDLVKELLTEINENLESESVLGQRCIYKVPRSIRGVNEELYTPELISIGPLHYGKLELTDVEKKKKQQTKNFLDRITKEKLDEIISFVKDQEKQIRACYTENPPLNSHDFAKMIFYDSIFIIETLISYSKLSQGAVQVTHTLKADMQLFENQLPYFILEKIYEKICELVFVDKRIRPTFMTLSCLFFDCLEILKLNTETSEVIVKHFTDLKRIALLKGYSRKGKTSAWVDDLPCAVKLHESGVKFKGIKDASLLDIRLEERKHLIPFFKVYELQIPKLIVNDKTECEFRNIIALEQCVYPQDALVSNYVSLMDSLIKTEEDVDLLVKNEIISNFVGDNALVANMFKKLKHNVPISSSSYYRTCERLKKHYGKPRNRAKGPLKRVYFSDPWRGTATVAAIILMFLTIVQTICSILKVV